MRKLSAEAELAERELPDRRKKMAAELVVSERQATRTWYALEWLKAATVPTAIAGLFITTYFSLDQIELGRRQAAVAEQQAKHAQQQFSEQVRTAARQAEAQERDRRLERLDRAISRLTSASAGERVAAVASIKLLLMGSAAERDQRPWISRDVDLPALISLIDRLSLEEEPVVQAAITSTFELAMLSGLEVGVLDVALQTVTERSRLLLGLAHQRIDEATNPDPETYWSKQLKESLALKSNSVTKIVEELAKQMPSPIGAPKRRVSGLSIPVLGTFQAKSTYIASDPLFNLAKVIESLFSAGARHPDLSKIYCANCTFLGNAKKNRTAAGTNFSGAILYQATFSDLDLSKSDFTDAHILGVSFHRTKLVEATIVANADLRYGVAYTEGKSLATLPVSFSCSDLTGGSFSVPVAAVSLNIARDGLNFGLAGTPDHSLRSAKRYWPSLLVYTTFNSKEPAYTNGLPIGKWDFAKWFPIEMPIEDYILQLLEELTERRSTPDVYANVQGEQSQRYFLFTTVDVRPLEELKKLPEEPKKLLDSILKIEIRNDDDVSQPLPELDRESCAPFSRPAPRSVFFLGEAIQAKIPWSSENGKP